MSNIENYRSAFVNAFGVDESHLEKLEYQEIEEWDSVGHMQLIALIEETFDIMIDTDDMIDFGSFEKGKEILSKYGITID